MNVCDDTYIIKFPNDMKIRTVIDGHSFKLDILENHQAWVGTLSAESIKHFAESLGKSVTDYWKEIKLILTSPNEINYSCTIENEYFICRKEIQNTNMKSIILKVQLTMKDVVDSLSNINDDLLEKNIELQSNLEKVAILQKDTNISNDELRNKLQKLNKWKMDMEQDLYGNFLILLNSKKQKIQELESIIRQNDIKNNFEEDTQITKSTDKLTFDNNIQQDDFNEFNSQHSIDDLECTVPNRIPQEKHYSEMTNLTEATEEVPRKNTYHVMNEQLDAHDLLNEL